MPKLIFRIFLGLLAAGIGIAVYFNSLEMPEVYRVQKTKVTSAVYGTIRLESTFAYVVRAQNSGIAQIAEEFSAGQGAVGKEIKKDQLVAIITDELRSRQLKQAKADLLTAMERAKLALPSAQPLKVATDNLQRLKELRALNNVSVADYQKAESEVARLNDLLKTELLEREHEVEKLSRSVKTLEEDLVKTEIRSPADGLLTAISFVPGDLVNEKQPLITVSTITTYIRGQINEEQMGEVRPGMKASILLYAYRTRKFTATVTSIFPFGDPETQRYTVLLEMENPPENIMPGMTGEMNIIIGQRENVLAVPTRAVLVDQALIVENGRVAQRTVQIGFRNIDFVEVLSGLNEGDLVVTADQDLFSPGQRVRPLLVNLAGDPATKP
jgi:RND family efflux transporter MFP subunit